MSNIHRITLVVGVLPEDLPITVEDFINAQPDYSIEVQFGDQLYAGIESISQVVEPEYGHDNVVSIKLTDGREFHWSVTNGQSAYQIALALGFVGTEQEWLASLVGPQGEQGIQGVPGADGTVKFEELTAAQRRTLKGDKGDPGEKGDKGDPLTWDDLTASQKYSLKGEKGDAFTFDDFTPEQLLSLKGDTVILGDGKIYTLYNSAGENTDGAMTQAAVTNLVKSTEPVIFYEDEWEPKSEEEKNDIASRYVEIYVLEGSRPGEVIAGATYLDGVLTLTGSEYIDGVLKLHGATYDAETGVLTI